MIQIIASTYIIFIIVSSTVAFGADDNSLTLPLIIPLLIHADNNQHSCDSRHLYLCDNKIDCEMAGGFWNNNSCNHVPVNAECGNNLLIGFDENLSSWGTFWNYWKGFQVLESLVNEDANCLKINVHGFAPGTTGQHTDTQVGYALYSDNNGEIGTLMLSGYREHYNWEEIGSGTHTFKFDTVHTTRNLEAGKKYWIVMNSSDQDVYIERQDPYINRPRRGSTVTDINTPPKGSNFTIKFNNGGYSWSVW